MGLQISPISRRDLTQFRRDTRKSTYADLYKALEEGKPVRVCTDTPREMDRLRRAMDRWRRRHGITVERVISGTTMMAAPLSLADDLPAVPDAPQASRIPTPAAARPGKAPAGSWEALMRPPDPPSYERMMGMEKKTP